MRKCALPDDAAAVTLYTWVDAQGVQHYSQFPPGDDEQAVDTLEIQMPDSTPGASAPLPENRIQTILDVARDLEDSRLQRERQRADQAAANAAATSPTPQNYESEPDEIFLPYPYGRPYLPHTYPPGWHPPWKNIHPKPEHPDKREPRPPQSRIVMPPAEEVPSTP